MEKPHASYWSVIPADVRHDDGISANAKIFYAEITSLTNKAGYCWAGNDYFMETFQFSDRTVTRLISELEKAGYIIRDMIKDSEGKVMQRRIYLRESALHGLPPDKIGGWCQNNREGPDKIGGENNISINKKENKKRKAEVPELSDADIHQLCVSWINEIAPESWSSFIKNGLYMALIRFYAPREKATESPKRSKVGFDALCSKLMRLSEGQPDAMMNMLDTATTSGWKSVYPPNGQPKKSSASQPSGEENVKWI